MNGIERDIAWHYPFIMGMSGRLGNRVYYMRDGHIRARRHVIPANPRTVKQQARRERFAAAVRAWRNLDDDARARWNRRGASMNRTGYNLFISEFMAKQAYVYPGIPQPVKSFRRPRRAVRVKLPRSEFTGRYSLPLTRGRGGVGVINGIPPDCPSGPTGPCT